VVGALDMKWAGVVKWLVH